MSAGTPAPQWPSVWDFGLAPLPQAIAFAGAVRSLTEAVLSLDAPSDRLDHFDINEIVRAEREAQKTKKRRRSITSVTAV